MVSIVISISIEKLRSIEFSDSIQLLSRFSSHSPFMAIVDEVEIVACLHNVPTVFNLRL
jgi:hypothetical protein